MLFQDWSMTATLPQHVKLEEREHVAARRRVTRHAIA